MRRTANTRTQKGHAKSDRQLLSHWLIKIEVVISVTVGSTIQPRVREAPLFGRGRLHSHLRSMLATSPKMHNAHNTST